MTELVEEVARVVFDAHFHPDDRANGVADEKWNEWPDDREHAHLIATALLPILARQRNEGIEAAAEVAQSYVGDDQVCTEIATAIRALKEPE